MEQINVKIKKLYRDAIIPEYAHDTDAGLDLFAYNEEYDPVNKCHIYGTGIAVEIPEGYVGLIFPRSSIRKVDAIMTNHVGVIDSGYRGEIMVTFKNYNKQDYLNSPYDIYNRIAQLIIIPYPKVNFKVVGNLSETDRGDGGHGSTGK